MVYEFTFERRVEFADTDMAGIVHFSNFFRYMEAAEHAFFRSLGQELHALEDGQVRGFVRVRAECEYLKPLHYQDLVKVHLLVREKGTSSLTYALTFRAGDDPEPVARGLLKVVCVLREPGAGRLRSRPIPPEINALLERAPSDLIVETRG